MMAKYGGYELGKDFNIMHQIPLTGEGIKMAWDLGADSDGVYPYLINAGMAGEWKAHVDGEKGSKFIGMPLPHIIMAVGLPALWVNKQGVRFVNEGLDIHPYVGNAVARQKDRICFTIFDHDIKLRLQEENPETLGYMDIPVDLSKFDEDFKTIAKEPGTYAFYADSIKELAAKIKIDEAALQQTIDEYNGYCDKGHDDEFAKNPKFLRPLRKPPFYAIRRTTGGYGTLGGIKINERAEVIDKKSEAIPGLYAAGDCANGTHVYDIPLVYILWGSTLSFAVNMGRIAGESAAEYIRK
jgi:fumarate reductase flavoprotein subunit